MHRSAAAGCDLCHIHLSQWAAAPYPQIRNAKFVPPSPKPFDRFADHQIGSSLVMRSFRGLVYAPVRRNFCEGTQAQSQLAASSVAWA
jgi:hypothetical protein